MFCLFALENLYICLILQVNDCQSQSLSILGVHVGSTEPGVGKNYNFVEASDLAKRFPDQFAPFVAHGVLPPRPFTEGTIIRIPLRVAHDKSLRDTSISSEQALALLTKFNSSASSCLLFTQYLEKIICSVIPGTVLTTASLIFNQRMEITQTCWEKHL
jgi:hypothetical protein